MNLRSILFVALVVVTAAGCDRQPDVSLGDIKAKMFSVVGHTPLGDHGAVSIPTPAQAQWFVIAPAGAKAASFAPESAFMKAMGTPPAGLLGLAEPSIAFVDGGKVTAIEPLDQAFTTKEVLAKPGRTVNGMRFVRLAGNKRSYVILALD